MVLKQISALCCFYSRYVLKRYMNRVKNRARNMTSISSILEWQIHWPFQRDYEQHGIQINDKYLPKLSAKLQNRTKKSLTKVHNAKESEERYTAVLRCIYNKVRKLHPTVPPSLVLRILVKRMNDCLRLKSIIPSLIVLGVISPSHQQTISFSKGEDDEYFISPCKDSDSEINIKKSIIITPACFTIDLMPSFLFLIFASVFLFFALVDLEVAEV